MKVKYGFLTIDPTKQQKMFEVAMRNHVPDEHRKQWVELEPVSQTGFKLHHTVMISEGSHYNKAFYTVSLYKKLNY